LARVLNEPAATAVSTISFWSDVCAQPDTAKTSTAINEITFNPVCAFFMLNPPFKMVFYKVHSIARAGTFTKACCYVFFTPFLF
jgi:hypothetical protein